MSKRDGFLALCLFALLFSVYLLTFSGTYHSSDEMSMLVATDSLARRGAWDIELLRWMGEQQGSFGPDGHLYSRKGIGTTLAALPLYWAALQSNTLGNVQAAMLTNCVLTALTGVLVFLTLRRLRYGAVVSLGTALAFGLGTMAWPYARYLFSESLAGLGLMLSAHFLISYGLLPTESPPGQGGDPTSILPEDGSRTGRWLYPLLAGVGLSIAMLARLNNALAAPLLGLLLLFYLYRRQGRNWRAWVGPILLFGMPVLGALALTGWYNWLRFESPLITGYLPEERFATPFLEGFYGLTFSSGKGFFWYNPILLTALVGWPAFLRKHRAEALLVAGMVLGNVAFYAPWYLWWAGHSWGPRFLVTILPLAALPLAPVLEAAARRRAVAAGLALLAAISLIVQLLGVAVDFNLYLEDVYAKLGLYHPATLFDLSYSPLLRQLGYLRPDNLDLAWARGNAVDWAALLAGVGLALMSALALWAAWRGRFSALAGGGLLALLALGAVVTMLRYTPRGDVAQAARAVAVMEYPGEAAALTDPLLTEAFQDAYDGHLPLWGVPSWEDVTGEHEAIWSAGEGEAGPAGARFQAGAVRLELHQEPGQRFDLERLPVPLLPGEARLGDSVQLVAVQPGSETLQPGDVLQVTLYWRALAPPQTSYTVSVQMIDEAGVKAGQADHLPCAGGCPTTMWRPGDLIGERYDLAAGNDVPPGRYRLIVGMYDLDTGERLPSMDAQGNVTGDYILFGGVDVQR